MATVLIPLAQGCEELEAVTVIDLLRRAGIEVVSAGLDKQPVRASRGTVLIADTDLDSALQQDYDMVVLPGGMPGADHLDNDPRIQALLKEMAANDKYTAAICAAPKVLASSGVLGDKKATAFPGVLEALGKTPAAGAVVADGRVITSRGPGTAMDFALKLIEVLVSKDKRDEVEKGLAK
ncbi:DJ-1 family glyoxalase III [Sulfuriflexus sp.]|uniref:DJ-1 family glyoxalase III n=1 Tax=Sulfuriflexus sp. TaxID=2015443 RepID=UPI0028CF9512|nr:DJ-1 family glyoxalase III [Sulfuriflexus sp.]MDT8404429.1 DJ-1/PfpI family protein [Sulfuriflexus sp.]